MNIEKAQQIVGSEPCCGEYETCMRACTPRGEWIGKREVSAYAVSLAGVAQRYLDTNRRLRVEMLKVAQNVPNNCTDAGEKAAAAEDALDAALAKNPNPAGHLRTEASDLSPEASGPVGLGPEGEVPRFACTLRRYAWCTSPIECGMAEKCQHPPVHITAPIEPLTGNHAFPREGYGSRGEIDALLATYDTLNREGELDDWRHAAKEVGVWLANNRHVLGMTSTPSSFRTEKT